MDYADRRRSYIKREMRFLPQVNVRQSFRVDKRQLDLTKNPFATPIVINNFNRLDYLRLQVTYLRERGYENIYVVDNASTYEPLLEYYETSGLRVFYLDTNVGYLALWKTPIRDQFLKNYYVYTDPDILPVDECPDDFMRLFYEVLGIVPNADKVGFGLKIDDIPGYNPLREQIVAHEQQFWAHPLGQNLYGAAIDTTFALYRPKRMGGWWLPAVRTGNSLRARHLPWYEDPNDLTPENCYYTEVTHIATHWSRLQSRMINSWPPVEDLVPWDTPCSIPGREEMGWTGR